MAVTMKTEKLYEILGVLFGLNSQQEEKTKILLGKGHQVSFGLFQFTAKVGEQVYAIKLPVISTDLLDPGSLTASGKSTISKSVSQVIEKAFIAAHDQKASPPPLNPAAAWPDPAATTAPIHDPNGAVPIPHPDKLPPHLKAGPSNKEVNAAMKAQAAVPVTSQGFTPQVVDQVVQLRNAKGVGQKVKGTSGGSIYRCFAVGVVNLAVKVGPGNLSVRAEAPGGINSVVKQKLNEIGFSEGSDYMSIHLSLGDVPAIRALGAITFSLDTKFDQIATNMEAINV